MRVNIGKPCSCSLTFTTGQTGADPGGGHGGSAIMTQYGTSYLVAVLVSLNITFIPRRTSGCTGERYRDCFV